MLSFNHANLIILCFTHQSANIFAKLSTSDVLKLRTMAQDAFLYSYDSYLEHGYPFDEVLPISCKYRHYDERLRGTLDDVLGNYMLTLVDSLDSLLIMRKFDKFSEAMDKISRISFATNTSVSVFETSIRVLGGLLSAHQLACRLGDQTIYDGETLLNHAINLADRLLPAFNTSTGIPLHRVNLLKGLIPGESTATCTAAGATFLLEMGLLSRLTGDAKYEIAAYKALKAIWERRSPLNLVGSLIDTHTGTWLTSHTGNGAGIDSFFETMLKSSILLGESTLGEWFEEAYLAVEKHTRYQVSIDNDTHRCRGSTRRGIIKCTCIQRKSIYCR